MAYIRKTKVTPQDLTVTPFIESLSSEFLNVAKVGEQHIADASAGGVLPTSTEIVEGLHAVGGALYEQLMDLAVTSEDKQKIVDGTVTIFKSIADQRLCFHQDEKDSYVVHIDMETNQRIVKTVDEANTTILRSAICYGVVSGLARSAAESIRDEANA